MCFFSTAWLSCRSTWAVASPARTGPGPGPASARSEHPGRILSAMALDLPRTLTPSKVTAFTRCPLAFRFSAIERRPEPPTPAKVKGTLVHGALEGLFWNHPQGARTRAAGEHELDRAWEALQEDPEFTGLELDPAVATAFLDDARTLVDNYFALEDPDSVRAVGVELGVEVTVDGMRLRGKIDRLDIGPDGSLRVVDYKTGRAPSERYERGSLVGVQMYALLCESMLGRAPVEVRLLHLREPIAITAVASEQTIRGQRRRSVAVWSAIERACQTEDFRPQVGPLCGHCHFKGECPAFAAGASSTAA
jgi:putative RecB family exonuclease